MTQLSVNINKIALIRNSRGRNYPDVAAFSERFLQLGAHGITLHPRPDQRHARYSDAHELKAVCDRHGAELNIEGNPTREFLDVVLAVLLLIGSVSGAQIGAQWAQKLPAARLRFVLAAIVLVVALRMALGLGWRPDEIYSIAPS